MYIHVSGYTFAIGIYIIWLATNKIMHVFRSVCCHMILVHTLYTDVIAFPTPRQ